MRRIRIAAVDICSIYRKLQRSKCSCTIRGFYGGEQKSWIPELLRHVVRQLKTNVSEAVLPLYSGIHLHDQEHQP
jgi:hypothetical protein